MVWAEKSFDRAVALYERVAAAERESLGSSHVRVAITLGRIAAVRLSQGRFDEALRVQREAASIQERDMGIRLGVGTEEDRLD